MNFMLIVLGILLIGFGFSTVLYLLFASKAVPNPEENEVYTQLNLSAQKNANKSVLTASKEKFA